MNKKKIGLINYDNIRWGRKSYEIKFDYSKWIEDSKAVPIGFFPVLNDIYIDRFLDIIDGVIIIGDREVIPFNYGEDPIFKIDDINYKDEKAEMLLIKKIFERKIPTLGVKRGLWLVNTVFGGSLDQFIDLDNTEKENYHSIFLENNAMLYDYYKEKAMVFGNFYPTIKEPAKGFKVVAKNKYGKIEMVESDNDHLFIGVQFISEYIQDEGGLRGLFKNFIDKV